jgi:hypothetical protein
MLQFCLVCNNSRRGHSGHLHCFMHFGMQDEGFDWIFLFYCIYYSAGSSGEFPCQERLGDVYRRGNPCHLSETNWRRVPPLGQTCTGEDQVATPFLFSHMV